MNENFEPDDTQRLYTAKDLVKFGNYCLSDERKITANPDNENSVHNEDLANWLNGR